MVGREPVETLVHSVGGRCAATLFRPTGDPPRRGWPGVVLGHGLANVRTMHLPLVAAALADGGIAALTIDYRHLGDSDGWPRQRIDPVAQRHDLRSALDHLARLDDIDADRLGLWGTSFAGGHVLGLAAVDHRVTCTVAQVPSVGAARYLAADRAPAEVRAFRRRLGEIAASGPQADTVTIPITAPRGEESFLGPTHLDWHLACEAAHPGFQNRITLGSLPRIFEDDPISLLDTADAPILVLLAADDDTTPAAVTRSAVDGLSSAIEIATLPGGHYDVYDDVTIRTAAIEQAVAFFQRNLAGGRAS